MLILRELNENDEVAFFEGVADWSEAERSWHTFDWEPGVSFLQMLERLKDRKAGLNLDPKHVPSTMYYGFVDGRIVGRLSVRHKLNDYLRQYGGHVGYAVAAQFRGRGYGNEMLRQGLIECVRLGLTSVMFTCADENPASWKMIEKVGGVLSSKFFDEAEKRTTRRYWLQLPSKTTLVPPTLETDRLILRPFEMTDAPRLQILANDQRLSATTTIPYPYPPGLSEEWIAGHKGHFEKGEVVHFAIVPKDTNEFVGVMTLFGISKLHRRAELGYWIAVEEWGKGYASEAAKAVVKYGFETMNLNRIHAGYVSTNKASMRVMEKIGMKPEGSARQLIFRNDVFHDLVTYSILKQDF